jgi:hypothetical protein
MVGWWGGRAAKISAPGVPPHATMRQRGPCPWVQADERPVLLLMRCAASGSRGSCLRVRRRSMLAAGAGPALMLAPHATSLRGRLAHTTAPTYSGELPCLAASTGELLQLWASRPAAQDSVLPAHLHEHQRHGFAVLPTSVCATKNYPCHEESL